MTSSEISNEKSNESQTDLTNRIECAIRHIQTAVDVDPWAVEIAVEAMERMASANLQPNLQQTCNLATDCIGRQAAIDAIEKNAYRHTYLDQIIDIIKSLPPAQPTLYGYPVEHLAMIARVLQKENLPPERVAKMLSDIGRIVEMARDEFEEMLRKAVEGCAM